MALLIQVKKFECGTAQPSSKHLVGLVGCQNHCQNQVIQQIRSLEKKTGKAKTYTHRHRLTYKLSANSVSAGQKLKICHWETKLFIVKKSLPKLKKDTYRIFYFFFKRTEMDMREKSTKLDMGL